MDTIKESGNGLLRVINDILDFSKIEAGHLSIEYSPFVLRHLVEESLQLYAAKAASKGIELLYYIDPKLPSICQGDALRIKQILSNLISNALKYILV